MNEVDQMIATPAAQSEGGASQSVRRFERAPCGIAIHWADGHQSLFHHVWLRDNRHCPACGNAATGYRYLRFTDVPPDVSPASVEVDGAGNLNVVWQPENHPSAYQAGWLRSHCCSAEERARRQHRPTLWDATLSRPPKIFYAEVIAGDEGHLRMLELVRDYGLPLVRNAPPINDRVAAPLVLPPDVIEPSYAAFAKLLRLCDRKEARIEIGLRPGDLMLIDNDRILHGRTGFVEGAGPRHFQQAHVARTDFHSRLRILGWRLGSADADLYLQPGSAG